MIVLDTDHLSVLERSDQPGSAALLARLAHMPPAEVVTTIISYEEQMRGWMAYLARTRSMAQQVEAYRRLLRHLETTDGSLCWPLMKPRRWFISNSVVLVCGLDLWT
jgi:predicted nucleic acid-binding protein